MRTMIAIPAMEQMFSWTVKCLCELRPVGDVTTEFVIRAPVDQARNMLAERAIEGGYDRILWIDSDMTFEPDLMQRLSALLDEGWDAATGLYFKRTFPAEPVIYEQLDLEKPAAYTYWNYPRDQVFRIAACGFGGVMVKTECIREMEEPPFQPFLHFSEDLSFCVRMAEKNRRIACDSRIKLGHMGSIVFQEKLYRHPADKGGEP